MEAEVISPSDYVTIPPAGALALTVPEGRALAFFTTPKAVDPVLAAIRKEIDAFSGDVKTAKGRKEIASMAHKISQSKSYLESVGKDLAAAQKEIPKKIDAARKTIRDTLDAWRDEVRAPLTKWEEAEQQRIDYCKSIVQHIIDCGNGFIGGESYPYAILFRELEEKVVINAELGEFEAEAHRAKDEALKKLKIGLAAQRKRDAEQAELDRLRKEAAERAEQDRLEAIKREAADKARAEAERKAKEEADRKEAAAKAERDAIEARARAEREEGARRERESALKAEEERLAAERREIELRRQAKEAEERARAAGLRAKQEFEEKRAREAAEAEAREADREHRAKINNAAATAFVEAGFSEDDARAIVTLIASRSIPNVTISY
jgi:septal ring factor EnvC (AmiA/AmiB activator)